LIGEIEVFTHPTRKSVAGIAKIITGNLLYLVEKNFNPQNSSNLRLDYTMDMPICKIDKIVGI